MIYGEGQPSWGQLIRRHESDENSGGVTVAVTYTALVNIDMGTVVAGDIILCEFRCQMAKGLAGGNNNYQILRQAGTCVIFTAHNASSALFQQQDVANGTAPFIYGVAILHVTTGGSLAIELQAASEGSDSTCGAGNAGLEVTVIRGS